VLKYWNEAEKKLDKKDDEKFWRSLTIERFGWIKDLISHDEKKCMPHTLASLADKISMNGQSKQDDLLLQRQNKLFKLTEIDEVRNYQVFEDYPETFTWLQLFCKLDFEAYIKLIPDHGDLKMLYEYIHAITPYVTNLYLKFQSKRILKSGHYYWMIIIGRLTNLQSLYLDDQSTGYFT
jgi:hypothetical protein